MRRNVASLAVFACVIAILTLSAVQLATGRDLLGPVWRRIRLPLVPVVLVLMVTAWVVNLAHRFGW
jgi:hypothetical protein